MRIYFLYLIGIIPEYFLGGGQFPPELPSDRRPPVRRLPLPAAHLLPAAAEHGLPGRVANTRPPQAYSLLPLMPQVWAFSCLVSLWH